MALLREGFRVLRSLVAKRACGIDPHRAAGGRPAGRSRGSRDRNRSRNRGSCPRAFEAGNAGARHALQNEGQSNSCRDPARNQRKAFAEDKIFDLTRRGSQRHTDSDLLGPPGDEEGRDAVNPAERDQQREASRREKQGGDEPAIGQRIADKRLQITPRTRQC